MSSLNTQVIQTPLSSDIPEDSTSTELHSVIMLLLFLLTAAMLDYDSLNTTTVLPTVQLLQSSLLLIL